MIRIRTFGTPQITVGTREVSPRAKALFQLVLYLGLERGRRIRRKDLAALIWGDADPERANHSLRQTLYELRKAGAHFGGDSTYVELAPTEVDIDVASLERDDIGAVEAAIAGDFLGGISGDDDAPYSEWIEAVRARVNARKRRVLLDELFRARDAGQLDRLEEIARQLRRIDPLNEEANCALAECLAARGSKVEALSTLDTYVSDIDDGKRAIRIPAQLLRERISRVSRQSPDVFTVGRKETLSVLRATIERAISAQNGSVVWISGEPGMGKSHLLLQVRRESVIRGASSVATSCPDRVDKRPLSAIAELVEQLVRAPGALGCDPDALRLLQRLTSEPGTVGTYPGNESDAREAIATAFTDLVDAVMSESPLLIAVDNVHWIDSASMSVLHHLARTIDSRACAIVFGSRTLPPTTFVAGTAVVVVPLNTLDDDESEALARALLPQETNNAVAVEWITRIGGGNPLHLIELAREVCQGGLGQVPQSLMELLKGKLRALSSDAENILLSIVLLATHASVGRIETLLGLPPTCVWNGLKELASAGLILDNGPLLRVRHDLLAHAVLEQTSPSVLRYAHYRIAQVLGEEVRTRGQSVVMTWDSAQHWRSAGQPQQAQALVHECVQHLLEVGLSEDAIHLLEDFLSSASPGIHSATFLNELGLVHASRKEWQAAIAVFDKARIEYRQTVDPATPLGQAITEAEWKHGRLTSDDAVGPFRQCLLTKAANAELRLAAATQLLVIADYCGNDALAAEVVAHIRELKSAPLSPKGRAELLRAETIYATFIGNVDEAVRLASQLVDDLRPLRSALAISTGYLWQANVLRRAGFIERAKERLVEASKLTAGRYAPDVSAYPRVILALLELYHGDVHEAARILDDVQASFVNLDRSVPYLRTDYLVTRAKVAFELGEYTLAQEYIGRINRESLKAHALNAYMQAINVKARATLRLGEQIAASDAIQIVEHHFANRHRSLQDYNALATYEVLMSQSREPEARRQIRDYFAKFRSDRYPPIQQLTRIVSEVMGKPWTCSRDGNGNQDH